MNPNVQAAVAKLATKIAGFPKPCSECGGASFAFSDDLSFVGQIKLAAQGNTIDPANGLALVSVSCKNCGNTKFYNYGFL